MTAIDPIPDAVRTRLAELNASLEAETNRNERVSVLIAACTGEGLSTGSAIRTALKALGYGEQHVSIILREGPKGMPPEYRWTRDEARSYRLP